MSGAMEDEIKRWTARRQSRKANGWDQEDWLGYPRRDSAGAWERLPALLKAALVWAFLRNGPRTAEDLARLHDGLCYGERGPIALATREEPRWIALNLHDLLPTMSWAQVDTAVSIFLNGTNPRSVKNRRVKAGESEGNDTWGFARKGEEGLRSFEADDYRRWLPNEPPGRQDFIVWLLRAWDDHLAYAREQRRKARQGDQTFSSLPDPNGVYEIGRKFPVDMGEWWLQKRMFDESGGMKWGYSLWRTNGGLPVDSYQVCITEIQRGEYPNGGHLSVRPSGPDAFIGGSLKGLKDFNAMVRAALDVIGSAPPDMHVEALTSGLDWNGIREEAFGLQRVLAESWWKRTGRSLNGRKVVVVARKAFKLSPFVTEAFLSK